MIDLKGIKKELVFNATNKWGSALEEWAPTLLLLKAMKDHSTVGSKYADGFMRCSEKEMLSRLGLSSKPIFKSKAKDIYYANSSVLIIERGEEEYIELTLLSHNENVLKRFSSFVKTLKKKKVSTVNVLTQGPGGIGLTALTPKRTEFIEDNYTSEVVQKYWKSVEDLKSESPHGRLHIINGPPGSGKTYMIRSMIQELVDSTVLILPANLVSSIDGPNLISTFISYRRYNKGPMTLVIEDADSCLVDRMADNMGSITSLLNCADGIMGSILDLRIIATTNQKEIKFDKALTRNGRLSQHIRVDSLCAEDANRIYQRLTETKNTPFSKETILADVYAEANDGDNGTNHGDTLNKKSNPIGFGVSQSPDFSKELVSEGLGSRKRQLKEN